jgi:hypothetical protein
MQASAHGQTIDPAIGFKIKIRVKTVVADALNQIQSLFLTTLSDASTTIRENIYELDSVAAKVIFNGLHEGSEIRIYRNSDGQELGGIESVIGTSWEFNYTWVGADVSATAVVYHLNYLPVYYSDITLDESGENILVQQTIDRQYTNPE